MRFNLWEDCNRVPLTELLSFIVDNRGKTVPTAPSGHKLIATNCVTNNTLFPVYDKIRYLSEETYQTWFRAHPIPGDILFVNKGTPGRVCIVPDPVDFCIAQDMIALRADESKIYPKYLFTVLRSREIQQQIYNTNVGDVIPHFKKQFLDQLLIPIPERSIQESIGDLYYVLSLKAERNKKINDNLQQQAAALFESWFVNYDPWDGVQPSEWENAPLGSFVEIKRGGSPRPIQDFLSDSGLRWLKISDVTSLSSPFVLEIKEHIKEEGLRKTVFLHAGELVLSNSATPGIPKILDVDTCIHDGWLYFPKSELSKYYLYLFFKHIRKELVALGNGSVFTNLKTDILKAFPATKADESTLKEFDALVTPLFDAMLNADRENFKLAAMRDALLPKLMSGEIDVSAIQL